MATRTVSLAGGNWSNPSTWDEGIVPTSVDDVVAHAGSSTTTSLLLDVPGFCNNFILSPSATFTLIFGLGNTLSVSGNIDLPNGTGFNSSATPGLTRTFVMVTTGSAFVKTYSNLFSLEINAPGGTVTIQSPAGAIGLQVQTALILTAGTLDTNNQIVTCEGFYSSNTNTRVLTMNSDFFIQGQGLINGGNFNTIWDTSTNTGLTINKGTSTVHLNNAAPAIGTAPDVLTIDFGGVSLYNVYIQDGNQAQDVFGYFTYSFAILSSFIITNDFFVNYPTYVYFNTGIIATAANFQAVGAGPTGMIRLLPYSPGGQWFLSQSTGTINITWCALNCCTATGGATFNGTYIIDGGFNVGWNITELYSFSNITKFNTV